MVIFVLLMFMILLFFNMKNRNVPRMSTFLLFIVIMFFIAYCVKYREKESYTFDYHGEIHISNKNDDIKQLSLGSDNLFIQSDKIPDDFYILKNIEIMYQNKKIGTIEINKKINELKYFKSVENKMFYFEYPIKSEILTEALNGENFKLKLNNLLPGKRNFGYKFKVLIENRKMKQKIEAVLDDIEIIYEGIGLEFNIF